MARMDPARDVNCQLSTVNCQTIRELLSSIPSRLNHHISQPHRHCNRLGIELAKLFHIVLQLIECYGESKYHLQSTQHAALFPATPPMPRRQVNLRAAILHRTISSESDYSCPQRDATPRQATPSHYPPAFHQVAERGKLPQ
jgi:hypothetical protein